MLWKREHESALFDLLKHKKEEMKHNQVFKRCSYSFFKLCFGRRMWKNVINN